VKLPTQAPPVVRDTALWPAQAFAGPGRGVMPSLTDCTGRVGCNCNDHDISQCQWCCAQGDTCGTVAGRCNVVG
jgi:hypothetical protein